MPPPKPGHPLHKGGEPPEKPNKVAVAIGTFIGRLVEYAVIGVLFAAMCAGPAVVVMGALSVMHDYEPAVPPFGFMFLWGAILGSSTLAMWAGGLVKVAMKEDE
jgi:hypothetical protein